MIAGLLSEEGAGRGKTAGRGELGCWSAYLHRTITAQQGTSPILPPERLMVLISARIHMKVYYNKMKQNSQDTLCLSTQDTSQRPWELNQSVGLILSEFIFKLSIQVKCTILYSVNMYQILGMTSI